MIGRLRGTLVVKQPPLLLVEAAGVGYELEAPMSTFYDLPETGREVILHTHLQIKEDAHQLYGFGSEAERSLFRALLKITGIGAKTALAILSGVGVDEFARLVQAGDVAAFVRVPGVGRKTAERIVLEMRDKAADFGAGPGMRSGGAATPADPQTEASSALAALGYKPAEVSRMVKEVAEPGMSAEAIIRKALSAALRN